MLANLAPRRIDFLMLAGVCGVFIFTGSIHSTLAIHFACIIAIYSVQFPFVSGWLDARKWCKCTCNSYSFPNDYSGIFVGHIYLNNLSLRVALYSRWMWSVHANDINLHSLSSHYDGTDFLRFSHSRWIFHVSPPVNGQPMCYAIWNYLWNTNWCDWKAPAVLHE